jgi:hypothetical protein
VHNVIPITWTLEDVVFNDSTTASGSFVYDADIGTYISYDILTSSGNVYGFVNPFSPGNSTFALAVDTTGDLTGAAALSMEFASALTNVGGIIDILPDLKKRGAGRFFNDINNNARNLYVKCFVILTFLSDLVGRTTHRPDGSKIKVLCQSVIRVKASSGSGLAFCLIEQKTRPDPDEGAPAANALFLCCKEQGKFSRQRATLTLALAAL